MKQKIVVLCLALLLCGCAEKTEGAVTETSVMETVTWAAETTAAVPETEAPTQPTAPAAGVVLEAEPSCHFF